LNDWSQALNENEQAPSIGVKTRERIKHNPKADKLNGIEERKHEDAKSSVTNFFGRPFNRLKTSLHSSLICPALLLVGQMDSFKSCVKEAINKMKTKPSYKYVPAV
jgi:hypothetical protein